MSDKIKVYLFSDNGDYQNIVLDTPEACAEWISNDDHNEDEDYVYTIKVAWMTQEELDALPEAD